MTEEEDFHKQKTIPGSFSVEPSEPAKVPEQIGPYKIDSLLARGGMSLLYLAKHPEDEHPIVVKVLEPKLLCRPEIVKRFIDEAKIIGLPDHPQIVKLFSHGEWEGGLYIAMEFIQGVSLHRYLKEHTISQRRALEMVVDIAYALCHLHTHGIIHRDLKPENVLITDSGEIKVIDFGISQLLTEKADLKGAAKQKIIGTPFYMSPEQREDPDTVSYPSDIYSLGIITYELVLGKFCHGRIDLKLIPDGIKRILKKALRKKPEERYQDIVDYISDITTYLDSTTKEPEPLSPLIEQTLFPKSPKWPGFEIEAQTIQKEETPSYYYDFIPLPNERLAIVTGKSLAKEEECLFCITQLRAMVRALLPTKGQLYEFTNELNQLIVQDRIDQKLLFSCLIIEKDKFYYTSCGYDPLWRIPGDTHFPEKLAIDNPPLGALPGANFREICRNLSVNDQLILHTIEDDSTMQEALKESPETPLEAIKEKHDFPFALIRVNKELVE